MSQAEDPVLQAALALPPQERERLADYLLARLHVHPPQVDEVDCIEAECRIEALRRGDQELLFSRDLTVRTVRRVRRG
jgi:hypothetical protein